MLPEEFLTCANKLATQAGATQADFRSATSRAYYAAFHTAKGILAGMNFTLSSKDTHKDVRDHLLYSGHTEAVAIAGKLGTLHQRRLDADYDLGTQRQGSKEAAQVAIVSAQELIQKIRMVLNGPQRSTIADGIRDWRNR